MSSASIAVSVPADIGPAVSGSSSSSTEFQTMPQTKPQARNRLLTILALLVFFLGCLACMASMVVGIKIKMNVQRAACSFGQSCENHFAKIHALEEPSRKVRQWLCASQEVQEVREERAVEASEQEALVQQWLGAEKASEAMLAKLGLRPKYVIGSATGIAGFVGALYFLGWWPSKVQKAA